MFMLFVENKKHKENLSIYVMVYYDEWIEVNDSESDSDSDLDFDKYDTLARPVYMIRDIETGHKVTHYIEPRVRLLKRIYICSYIITIFFGIGVIIWTYYLL